MKVCKRVTYSGRVQGVGFRYTTRSLAGQFPVTGYVRNLSGGDVELVAEGEADEIEGFLTAVEEQMAGYIDGRTVAEEPPRGFTDFAVRR